MSTTQITTQQVIDCLSCLYGCDTSANQIVEPAQLGDPMVVATYNDGEGVTRFAIACELPLANSLGAALTMIPPGGAEDATSNGEVPTNIADNLKEVFNICSSVFTTADSNRIVLDQVYLPGEDRGEFGDKLQASDCLLQVKYGLERYQDGAMSLLQVS